MASLLGELTCGDPELRTAEQTANQNPVFVQISGGDGRDGFFQFSFTHNDIKHTPVEYLQMGRVFCGIDFSEGARMTKAVNDLLGDHVLMYQSDYPHPETLFPDHVDTVVGWREELGEPAMTKLMWENAARFLRLASTTWGD